MVYTTEKCRAQVSGSYKYQSWIKKGSPPDRVLTVSEGKLWEKVVGESRLKFSICTSLLTIRRYKKLLYVLQVDLSIRVYRLNASEWKPQALQMHQDKQNFERIR